MSLKVVTSCPLGHTCEKVEGDTINRCQWYTNIKGNNPQTGEAMDKWDCAMAWQPLLLIENSQQSRAMAATFQSLRNAAIENQKAALGKPKDD